MLICCLKAYVRKLSLVVASISGLGTPNVVQYDVLIFRKKGPLAIAFAFSLYFAFLPLGRVTATSFLVTGIFVSFHLSPEISEDAETPGAFPTLDVYGWWVSCNLHCGSSERQCGSSRRRGTNKKATYQLLLPPFECGSEKLRLKRATKSGNPSQFT